MPQSSAASAFSFIKILETLDDVPQPDENLLGHCRDLYEKVAIPKTVGGLEQLLEDVNSCRDLCATHLEKLLEHIYLMEDHLAEIKKHLGYDIVFNCYKNAIDIIKKTRKDCAVQKERYSDAVIGLLFVKDEIKDELAKLKEKVECNDHEWVWVSDEYSYMSLKDWVNVGPEI